MSFVPGGSGGSKISTSQDVALSNPLTGEVLTYDGSASLWKNQSVAGALKGVVVYNTGSSSYPARPAGYVSIEWIGPVDPGTSAQDNDTWINTA